MAEPVKISEEDAARYDSFFVLLDAVGSGRVSRLQAEPLFERAALAAKDVDRIWKIADADGDGMLSLTEFRVAMQLATYAAPPCPVPCTLMWTRTLAPFPAFDSLPSSASSHCDAA